MEEFVCSPEKAVETHWTDTKYIKVYSLLFEVHFGIMFYVWGGPNFNTNTEGVRLNRLAHCYAYALTKVSRWFILHKITEQI